MKGLIRIFCVTVFLFTSSVFYGQNVKFTATLDTNSILIGEQVKLKLQFEFTKKIERLGWPQPEGNMLTDNIAIVKANKIDSTFRHDDNNVKWTQELILTSFDSGTFVIPSIPIAYSYVMDTAVHRAYTDSLLLYVNNVSVDTTLPFKDIVGPRRPGFSFSEIADFIMWGVIILLVAFIAFYIYKRIKKNKPVLPIKKEPELLPDVEALDAFERLKQAKMWQNGLIKGYYTGMTDIIRTYIEKRLGIQAVEMTTEQIIEAVEKAGINKEVTMKLEASLDTADLVKFAKFSPGAFENDLSLQRCIDFVNETKNS